MIQRTNPNPSNHNTETLDLQFAEEAQLSIIEGALVNLASYTNAVIVNGHTDDTVTISGAKRTGTEAIDG